MFKVFFLTLYQGKSPFLSNHHLGNILYFSNWSKHLKQIQVYVRFGLSPFPGCHRDLNEGLDRDPLPPKDVNKILVVTITWKGTTQDLLRRCCGSYIIVPYLFGWCRW